MAYFRVNYRRGKERSHTIVEAVNRIEAMKEFQAKMMGVMISLEEISEPLSIKFEKITSKFKNPIKNKRADQEAYIALLEQMAVMLDAGMPINLVLKEVSQNTDNAMIKAIFTNILSDVESGASLSEASKRYSLQLGNLSISMIDLGEKTGSLSESIKKLAEILQEIHDNRMKLKRATRYPLLTIFAMAIAFGIVILFVIPQFEAIFAASHTELPFPTRILIWLEHALQDYGPFILMSAFIIVAIFSYFYKHSKNIKFKSDKIFLKIYLVGLVTKYAMIGRFMYIFQVLSDAGIPMIEALDAANKIVDNSYMRYNLDKIAQNIEDGGSLANGFAQSNFFENMIVQMVSAAEQSGALGQMLEKIVKFYKDKYDGIIENVSTMIEPILIAAIAGFVLILALGIFLPMWSLGSAAGL